MLASRPETVPPAAVRGLTRLVAPCHWQAIDVVADLHLQAAEPNTFDAFQRYLHEPLRADALLILGDLFEFWVGDDALAEAPRPAGQNTPSSGADSKGPGFACNNTTQRSADTTEPSCTGLPELAFWRECAALLRQHAARRPVYFMVGNRDFLLQERAAQAMGMQALTDPCVLLFGPEPWLLSHGDALCLADHRYQSFRREVRSNAWQQAFLAQTLPQRIAQARGLRQQSEAQRAAPQAQGAWADLDEPATRACLLAHGCQRMLHGHTHRPGEHALGQGLSRLVLSDWDASARRPRAEVLRLHRLDWERLAQPLG